MCRRHLSVPMEDDADSDFAHFFVHEQDSHFQMHVRAPADESTERKHLLCSAANARNCGVRALMQEMESTCTPADTGPSSSRRAYRTEGIFAVLPSIPELETWVNADKDEPYERYDRQDDAARAELAPQAIAIARGEQIQFMQSLGVLEDSTLKECHERPGRRPV